MQMFDELWQGAYPPVFLAPMAGATDYAARTLAKEQGADVLVTEMVSAKALTMRNEKTALLLPKADEKEPIAVQLFGHEPQVMHEAGKILAGEGYQWLDINMGCPVPKVVGNGDGSALFLHPETAAEVVAALAETVPVVTVKIRVGWNDIEIDKAVSFAQRLAKAGAKAIVVHGRSRRQFYSGEASRVAIKAIVDAVGVPVVANGDIIDGASALSMWQETGAQGLMIGRASQGNPWIFAEVHQALRHKAYEPPSLAEKKAIIERHASLLAQDKGEYIAFREMRKHLAWYSKGLRYAAKIRQAAAQVANQEDLDNLLARYFV